MIRVISQTTKERKQETHERFLEIKPYLDQGFTLSKAVQKHYNINHLGFYGNTWYKELKEYVEIMGYKSRGNY